MTKPLLNSKIKKKTKTHTHMKRPCELNTNSVAWHDDAQREKPVSMEK